LLSGFAELFIIGVLRVLQVRPIFSYCSFALGQPIDRLLLDLLDFFFRLLNFVSWVVRLDSPDLRR